jgi:hypothetical protein
MSGRRQGRIEEDRLQACPRSRLRARFASGRP